MSALERMCFLVTGDTRLNDNSIEMYDPKQKRTFLKRTKTQDLALTDFHIGAAVNVYARQLTIVDYGDEFTRGKLAQTLESALVIIKPDAIDQAGEIIDILISNHNYTIRNLRMLSISRKLAEELCMVTFGGKPYFNDIVSSLTGGSSIALEVTKPNAHTHLTTITGPAIVADARAQAAQSLRARFGHAGYKNGLHISSSASSAKVELSAVFNHSAATAARTAVFKNSTLALVRPHAVYAGLTGKIMASIVQNGFRISDAQSFSLDRVNAEEFLEVYKTVVPEYQKIVDQLMSGPLVALEVSGGPDKEHIVSSFREIVGPTDPELARKLRPKSLRALYGVNKIKNAVHCTDLEDDGVLEVQFFFRIMANVV
ncbi:Nucleoside diphosphate kinase 7 [Physocladia obscura]|uniref:Nucleoside diphosphate kinase n=1 Tax=Physocladia obscura TaxID=109957 RepID=A0AAD5T4H6_9FUNG|nr:Nucleoside diphosphate kinase 7 [Physocladia obscura]